MNSPDPLVAILALADRPPDERFVRCIADLAAANAAARRARRGVWIAVGQMAAVMLSLMLAIAMAPALGEALVELSGPLLALTLFLWALVTFAYIPGSARGAIG